MSGFVYPIFDQTSGKLRVTRRQTSTKLCADALKRAKANRCACFVRFALQDLRLNKRLANFGLRPRFVYPNFDQTSAKLRVLNQMSTRNLFEISGFKFVYLDKVRQFVYLDKFLSNLVDWGRRAEPNHMS